MLLAACGADRGGTETPADAAPDAPASGEIVLTDGSPSAEMPLGDIPADPAAVEVTVTRIANPAGEAFSIQLALVATDPEGEFVVGSVTPFPADRTGVYVFAISQPADQFLDQRGPDARLRVSLEPAAPDRPLPSPLEVAISEPVWR